MDSQRPSSSQRPSQAILQPNIDANDINHPGKANIPIKVYKGGALTIDARIRPYVVAAGFYPWTQVCDVKADPSLLTAVVERWGQKHTPFILMMERR
ncbi:hypothetical protein QQ045_031977 [Rhodiola kirilowii]